jgi:2-polyprenyl-3-methyl-5-hydroxy-6-metoxy-1,4-benzoquinol methylase
MSSSAPATHAVDYDQPLARCPLCDSDRLARVLTDLRGNPIDRCGACGVQFMNPQYSDAFLRRFYAGYISQHPGDDANRSHRGKLAVRLHGKRASLALLGRLAPGRRILMVGCGDGLELDAARELGWQAEGYDVDPQTTAAVAARCGATVHCGEFASLPARAGAFDAVFLDQVIEHPKDPAAYLRTCVELLRPGGVLFLGTPNIGSLSNRLKTLADQLGLRHGGTGRHYNTRHHLFFFTPAVLGRLLEQRFGLRVLLTRASCKPQRNPVTGLLGRWLPVLDSSFLVVARRP